MTESDTSRLPAGEAVDAATRAHFAARAASYAGGGEASLAAILELAAVRPGERVLDVATGTGEVLWPLAEGVGPDGLAAGLDFTPAMLDQAARRRVVAGRRPVLVAAHAARLPFGGETFDVVTCRFGVHHFADPVAGLGAMAAVLRPGGRLVIADFVRPEDETAAAALARLEALRGHVYVDLYPESHLGAMLAGAGCPVIARRAAPREVRPADWLARPDLSPEARAALGQAIQEVVALAGSEGGGRYGLQVREDGGETRLVRLDAVLLGIKTAP
jgi:SAM-dependent methyltransferase